MENKTLNLTVKEINYIITILSQRPYAECYAIIEKIKNECEE